MQVAVHVRPRPPASLASAHAIPSLLAFARFRPPAAQIEVFGNNLRPLHRLWQLFPLAAMDALGTNFLTRHFAWEAFGEGRNSALARSREEHSTEIMVKKPGNHLQVWQLFPLGVAKTACGGSCNSRRAEPLGEVPPFGKLSRDGRAADAHVSDVSDVPTTTLVVRVTALFSHSGECAARSVSGGTECARSAPATPR